MAKLILQIPDDLLKVIKKRNGSPAKYIEAVLINPLLDDIEQAEKKEIFSKELKSIDTKLKKYRKEFTIKVKE